MGSEIFVQSYRLARDATVEFLKKDPITLAGALGFFTIFAIPPILIIIIVSVGFFTGETFISEELFAQVRSLWGEQGEDLVRNLVDNYIIAEQSFLQQITGVFIFLFASSTFFIIIQHALNSIWRVKPKPANNLLNELKNRLISFGLILLLGILIMISFALESFLVIVRQNIDSLLPQVSPILFNMVGHLLSFLMVILIIAVIYKYLPAVIIEWKVVWVGAAITSFLFTLGKLVISWALGNTNINEMYGVVGALVIILLWVFYSALILFYGAEITRQYALSYAQSIHPKKYATRIVVKEVDRNYSED